MLMSLSLNVTFRVKAKTLPGEKLFLVGSSNELGEWDPHQAVMMRRTTGKKVNSSEVEEQSYLPEQSKDGDIWSKNVKLEGAHSREYRYFIGRMYASDTEGDEDRGLIVKWWEGHIKPRTFSPQGYLESVEPLRQAVNSIKKSTPGNFSCQFVKHAITRMDNNVIPEPDVFGDFDGLRLINWGWLTDHSEIQLQLHSDPINMWKPRYRSQTYSIKCTPISHKYKDAMDDHYEEEMLGDSVPSCTDTELLVSVLEKGLSKPRPQSTYGTIYKPGNFMTIYLRTFDPESLGFQLDYYVHEPENETPRHVGFSFLLPLDVNTSTGHREVPITGFKHRPIGQIKVDYLIVKPMISARFSMKKTFQRYWKSTRRPVDVGHRGLGSSYKCQKLAVVTENTIRSLQSAANHGADFVEFDVQLTKDLEAVIYHDFKVLMAYRKKKREDLELFEIPVKDIKLAELQQMKLSHTSYQPEYKYEGIHEDDDNPDDLQPFPTLQQVFETVDKHTGFNIEIKYPTPKVDGSNKIADFFDMNKYIDIILSVVFKHHAGRRIIFSSFDPNISSLLRLKQNVFPVLYLTQATSERYTQYSGVRTQSVQMATEFAQSAGLLGVDVLSDVLLKDMSLIKCAKDAGLVVFVWGELCNSKETIQAFKDHKVDGIIYDRIDFYKTGEKESIFKIEDDRKKELLRRVGSLYQEDNGDSGTDSQ